MKCVELFCGRGGWSKGMYDVFRDKCLFYGIDTRDFNYPFRFIKADILDWEPDQDYDIVLASPPCSEFSEIKRNCAIPYDERQGLDLVYRTFALIEQIKPKFWVLENVKGLTEFLGPEKEMVRYGKKSRKAAYLYGNFPELGFFDESIEFDSTIWHDKKISGWEQCKTGIRGEIPIALARQLAKKLAEVLLK